MTAPLHVEMQTPSTAELSPLWRGYRISVIIPTYNRKEKLLKCLQALGKQSILAQEFEAIIVDDGSTDGTEHTLTTDIFPFPIHYFRQDHQGPGMARNLGIQKAQGELVLFIGDDIIADERLLENHLLAHAHFPSETTAVLGYITWPVWMEPNQVMIYIYGESGLQFAYEQVARASSLDYRFFYTSNISLKRRFLLSAARAGVRFDPEFRYAAFEDIEFGYRLQSRGLEVQYWKDAIAYHDHWMDLESFSRREYLVGQMSVVFYRKHPALHNFLSFSQINDWIDAAEKLSRHPDSVTVIKKLDNDIRDSFRSLAASLEDLLKFDIWPDGNVGAPSIHHQNPKALLNGILEGIFAMEQARGKVQEWCANVEDKSKVEIAQSLASCIKGVEFFNPSLVSARIAERDQQVRALTAQVAEKEQTIAMVTNSRAWKVAVFLQKIRKEFIPDGSRRFLLMQLAYRSLKIWRTEGLRILTRKVIDRLTTSNKSR